MDNYVVISERDLDSLRYHIDIGNVGTVKALISKIRLDSISAQELWDAAELETHMQGIAETDGINRQPKTLTDFLTSKFPNNG